MKKIISSIIMLAMVGTMFAGCGGTQPAASNAPEASKTATTASSGSSKVSIVGSTTVQPVAQEVADEFKKANPNISVEIQGVGSSAGIKSITAGSCDIGTSSRQLTAEEKKSGLTEHIIAYDAIAVIVNPANKVTGLTKAQIKDIFEGTITNWKDVGGDDSPITVVVREEGSGTRSSFEDLDGIKDVSPIALNSNSNGAVKTTLASKKNAIGYMSLGMLDNTVKPLTVDGVVPSDGNAVSGKYIFSRSLLMLTKGDLSAPTKAYLDFLMGPDGQKIVAQNYIPVATSIK